MYFLDYISTHFFVIIIVLSYVDISSSWLPDGFICHQRDSCSCVGNNGELIDLSLLVDSSQPLIAATTTSLYIYHPCKDVPLNSLTNNSCHSNYGLCYFQPQKHSDQVIDFQKVLHNETQGNFMKLALNDESVFRVNSLNQIEIVYKHTTDATVTTYVMLDCLQNSKSYELLIEKSSPLEHILVLKTHYACITSEHHMSGAAVFFLILFIFILIYFIGGILVLKFIRGARGVEMIPNYEFWGKLIKSAKTGITYIINRGKSTPDSYETI